MTTLYPTLANLMLEAALRDPGEPIDSGKGHGLLCGGGGEGGRNRDRMASRGALHRGTGPRLITAQSLCGPPLHLSPAVGLALAAAVIGNPLSSTQRRRRRRWRP